MHENNSTFTTNDLISIFDTTKTSLYNHIKYNHLKSWLVNNHHMNTGHYRTTFDIYGMAKIAKTFENRIAKPKHKRNHQNKISNYTIKKLGRSTDQINNKLDKIINHLNIGY